MAVIRKNEPGDAAVRPSLKGDAGAAATGIEKPVGELGQQLSLIAGTVPGHQLVALAEDGYLGYAGVDILTLIRVINAGIDVNRDRDGWG